MAIPPDDQQHIDAAAVPLLAKARNGDIEAFNGLVLLYQRQAFSVAARMLGNWQSAEDVTQEAFFAAYQSLASLRGDSFRVWLLRIVANRCLDYLRAGKKRTAVSLDAEDWETGQSLQNTLQDNSTDWDPEAFAERSELLIIIQTGLMTLPHDLRIAVILCDVEGYSYEEIGAIMNTPTGTVKSRIARGRERLQIYLREHGELKPSKKRLEIDQRKKNQPQAPYSTDKKRGHHESSK